MAALWILNLDADEELERPLGYNPTQMVDAQVRLLLPKARRLLAADDVLWSEPLPVRNEPLIGKAWCPTPSALRRLERAGARVPVAPALDVLRRANHRRFSFELGPTLPRAVFLDSGEPAPGFLEAHRSEGPWVVKRAFGFAGRGQRRIQGAPSPDDVRWLTGTRSDEGLLIEPWVHIVRELCIHGFIEPDGRARIGAVSEQECDDRGVWLRSRPIEVRPRLERELRAQAERVAGALADIGYFGPFGIDAYEYVDARGRQRFNPLGEINARYTMGYALGTP